MFSELGILLNSHVEITVILNYIDQDKNKVLVDESKKTVQFHRLDSSMEESMSTFQLLVEA